MKDFWNYRRPSFWWFWLLVFYIIASSVLLLTFESQDTLLNDTYAVELFRNEMLILAFPIVLFLAAVWLFPRLTQFEFSLPLAVMQWGIVAIGIFMMVLPKYSIPLSLRFEDLPETYEKYNSVALAGGWLFWIGVAAFLPVLLEALVKKRPFEHKLG